MKKYPIHKDLRLLWFLRPVLWPPLMPFLNALRGLAPYPFSGEVNAARHAIRVKPGQTIPALVISPLHIATPAPCLVYFHGGAFMLKAARHHHRLAEELAIQAPCVVVVPDYRLAPRHPFPVPADDCYQSYHWVVRNATSLGVDPKRLAVGGDSAGGALAAATCLMARDREFELPCFQLLLYPVTSRKMDSGSMKQFKRAPVWNAAQNRQMWKWYLPKRDAAHIEYASPLEAPAFAGLPPAYIEVAQLDPLRDQGEAFADALQDAGVLARLVRVTGAVHGFDLMKNSGLVSECIKLRALALRNAFYGDGKENSSENEANVPVGHL